MGSASLLLQPALLRGASRTGRAAPLGAADARGELLGQPLQSELAVSLLAAGVLGDGGYALAEPFAQAGPLLAAEHGGRLDVEDRLDPRGGHVRVLATRPGGAARAQLDLLERDLHAVTDSQPVGHAPTVPVEAAGRVPRVAAVTGPLETLTKLLTAVESLDSEVKLMRAAVEDLRTDVRGVRASVEPLEHELVELRRGLRPIGRITDRFKRGDGDDAPDSA